MDLQSFRFFLCGLKQVRNFGDSRCAADAVFESLYLEDTKSDNETLLEPAIPILMALFYNSVVCKT